MSNRQKIVYPSVLVASGGDVLLFVYPARNISAYAPDEICDDAYSSYGDHERVLERLDHYLEFEMPFIMLGSDQQNWQNFLDWAAQGCAFDFYPDVDSASYTTYHMVSKGNKIEYRSPNFYKIATMRMRQVIT